MEPLKPVEAFRRRTVRTTVAAVLALAIGGATVGGIQTSAQEIGTTATKAYPGGQIVIPNKGPAIPYPSTIRVRDLPGIVENVELTLFGVSHEFADDIDIALVGPDGTTVTVMSDVGGDSQLNRVNLVIADSNTNGPMPDTGAIGPGRYEATNAGEQDDDFNGPVAPNTATNSMTEFEGGPANGLWQLFVQDDRDTIGGSIQAWALTIEATDYPVRATNDSYSVKENGVLRVRRPGVLKNDRDTDDDIIGVSVKNKPRKGNLKLRRDGSFTYKPDRDETGSDSFTYEVTDGGGARDSAKVTINIEEKRDRD